MVDSSASTTSHSFPGSGQDWNDIFGKLDIGKKEIRIVELHAAPSDGPLTATLRRTSTLNPCSYEALSWSWGPEKLDSNSKAATIILNSNPMQIRTNLATALRTLRRVGASRTLWIDAVCIKQSQDCSALQEKQQQIQLMAEIFQSAERVLIWLDPKLHLLQRALPSLMRLSDPEISQAGALCAVKEAQEKPWGRSEVSPDRQVRECTMLQWMIWVSQFPYWRRLWVVQEVALARCATIICDQQLLDFEVLVQAVDRMRQLEIDLFELDPNIAIGLAIVEQSIGLFRDCRRQVAFGCSTPMKVLSGSNHSDRSTLHQDCLHFARLLSMCRGQLSTDPRDKVYGLLGLSSEGFRSIVKPQYATGVNEIFLELAKILLHESRSLFPLSQAVKYWYEDEIPRHDVPSWLPNWAARERIIIEYEQAKYRLRQQTLFRACGTVEADSVKFESNELVVDGVTIDHISSAQTYSRWQEGRYLGIPNLDFLMSWLDQSRTGDMSTQESMPVIDDMYTRFLIPKSPYRSMQGEQIESIFWQTWSHDQEPTEDRQEIQRCSEDFLSKCKEWRQQHARWVQNGRDVQQWQGPGPNIFGNDLWGATDIELYHGRLFFTQDGFLGLTGRPTMPGDKICILAGGHLPFILRPSEDNSNQLRLVCECFIQGVMDGEATVDPKWSDQWRRSQSRSANGQPDETLGVIWEKIVLG